MRNSRMFYKIIIKSVFLTQKGFWLSLFFFCCCSLIVIIVYFRFARENRRVGVSVSQSVRKAKGKHLRGMRSVHRFGVDSRNESEALAIRDMQTSAFRIYKMSVTPQALQTLLQLLRQTMHEHTDVVPTCFFCSSAAFASCSSCNFT